MKRGLTRAERVRIQRLARSGKVVDQEDAPKVQTLLACVSFVPAGMTRKQETLNLLIVVLIGVALGVYFMVAKQGTASVVLGVGGIVIAVTFFVFRLWLVKRYQGTARANGWADLTG
jgi:hypothetical protein